MYGLRNRQSRDVPIGEPLREEAGDPRHPKLIKAIASSIVGNLIFPCVYMMGRKAVAIAEV
jgi:hypothetical protein